MSRLLVWGVLGLVAVGGAFTALMGLAWLGSAAGGELGMALAVGAACLGLLVFLGWLKSR